MTEEVITPDTPPKKYHRRRHARMTGKIHFLLAIVGAIGGSSMGSVHEWADLKKPASVFGILVAVTTAINGALNVKVTPKDTP